jgi:hypothetical protein
MLGEKEKEKNPKGNTRKKDLQHYPIQNAVSMWLLSLKASNDPLQQIQQKQGGVSHCGLSIYIKSYLKAKKELQKLNYFTMQKYNLQKNPLKETKILQDMRTL